MKRAFYEVGRVLDALDEMGITKDTLIIEEIGDNGASLGLRRIGRKGFHQPGSYMLLVSSERIPGWNLRRTGSKLVSGRITPNLS
jgi:arylsulfatase A-like enzyme